MSGNTIYCSCFRIFTLSCCPWSALVRWCPSLSAAIVTQLVTRAVFLRGVLSDGLSLSMQPLSVGGSPVLRDFLQSVSSLFLGRRHGAGQVVARQLGTHRETRVSIHGVSAWIHRRY